MTRAFSSRMSTNLKRIAIRFQTSADQMRMRATANARTFFKENNIYKAVFFSFSQRLVNPTFRMVQTAL